MNFSDYPSGSLFVNICGVTASQRELVRPQELSDLSSDEQELILNRVNLMGKRWKNYNIYRRL